MARISEHIDVARDLAAGKPATQVRLPWNSGQPGAQKVQALEDKARAVLAGTAHFTREETELALARLTLG